MNAEERNALLQPNVCDMNVNPTVCMSSCDGSIVFPDHAKLDFENLANYELTKKVGIEIRQTRWNSNEKNCTDDVVWPVFYWKKILQYHDMYSPSSGEVSASNLNSPPSEVGFAKLSDDSINEMKSIDGFYYYKIEQEVYEDEDDEFSFGNRENSFIYIRTKNEFIDTMKSFGFSDSYETCQGTIDVEDCTWQFQNNLPYLNSFNEYGSTALDTWMTDRDGTIDCGGI